jgi:hypothetical protein
MALVDLSRLIKPLFSLSLFRAIGISSLPLGLNQAISYVSSKASFPYNSNIIIY